MSVDDILDDVLTEGGRLPTEPPSVSTGSEETVGDTAGSGSALVRGSEPERVDSERGEEMVTDGALPSSPRTEDRGRPTTNREGGLPTSPDEDSGAADVAASSVDAERSGPTPRVSAPEYTELDVEGIPLDSPKGKASTEKLKPARRGMARQRERSGRCPMYAPSGTVCKTCGKVHPL